ISVDGRPRSVAFSPDGKRLAAGGEFWGYKGQAKAGIVVWDSVSAKELFVCAKTGDGYSIAFSPDGKYLASSAGTDKETLVGLWDSTTGQEIRSFRKPNPILMNQVVFSPDSRWLALADRTVHVWDVRSGKEVVSLPGGDFTGAAFSPDG